MCKHEDCSKAESKKGFCEAHYYQWYRLQSKEIDTDDFWEFVKKQLRLEMN
jgi:hypothetical protein